MSNNARSKVAAAGRIVGLAVVVSAGAGSMVGFAAVANAGREGMHGDPAAAAPYWRY